MTIRVYWQLDVAEDAARSEPGARQSGLFRDVRPSTLNRYDYYAQVAQAAAQTAFDGLFVPHRPQSDDSNIVVAAIAREAPRLSLIPEFPASAGSAVYAAKQAVSFQRQTHERLGWAIADAGEAAERARDGDHVPEEQVHARVEEFLTVARGVHAERPFSFAGAHFEVEGGGFHEPLNRVAFPKVFLQGESEEALALSARAADVHLFAAAPLSRLGGLAGTLDGLALREGRSIELGLVQPVLAREDAGDARRDAARAGLPDTAIAGSYAEVAERLAESAASGFRHFVLAAPSSLEEAYRIGQHVLPRFRALTERVAATA
ncbi:alkanesulfonate monooxygenase [Sphingomonas naasensis]|uniref:LLM class flavin-dependent oxidoreductase n=1 Tax=Sphingomonas naasensis TaxID=1344951 RepID=A0A4S1WM84_9SPHN|nr:LLM class flavin-dependent oxidoreductase [Sphingomonas naasensis]NIJ20239.1 alkanesulfonate monooxygenase [Sphingomonas naasensis]TGX44381.1 LLM class flavin-dependent oxidoreductase [Sphingomonas naasensis]